MNVALHGVLQMDGYIERRRTSTLSSPQQTGAPAHSDRHATAANDLDLDDLGLDQEDLADLTPEELDIDELLRERLDLSPLRAAGDDTQWYMESDTDEPVQEQVQEQAHDHLQVQDQVQEQVQDQAPQQKQNQ